MTKLSRRDFIKTAIAAAFAGAVPLPNVTVERGAAVTVTGRFTDSEWSTIRRDVMERLAEDARKNLSIGTPFELRGSVELDYGRARQFCWYSAPSMWKDGGITYWWPDSAFDADLGHYPLARQIV